MNGPIIPNNLEAEIAVLGCIFIDDTLIIAIGDELAANDFYDQKNKELFNAMSKLHTEKKHIDVASIVSELVASNKLDYIGGVEYIYSITDYIYSTANIDTYVALVKEASLKRKTIDVLNMLSQKGYDASINANDYITNVEELVYDLSKQRKTEQFSRVDAVLETVRLNTQKNFNNTGTVTGLDTGFDNLNQATLGFQKGNLIIVAARPAMGKSAFAMNLAVQIAEKNIDKHEQSARVAVFSLEMGADQLVERMIASEASLNISLLKKGNLTEEDWRRYNIASEKLSTLNIYFDDSSLLKISDIRTKCRKLSAEKGLDFVIIDYLQLIEGDPGKSKQEEVSKISRSLKLMARELDVPVVALAQLSREVERRTDKRPIMADLRDSGSIEQDADIVMFLYRDDYYNKETSERPNEADVIISKNRSGTAGIELRYIFHGALSKFQENNK